ncbi:hypothetical protein ACFQ3C_04635 [Seohaeicola saemankumensis]|uniref:Uncharacterized protein n=1 Tax=Seohaeicola saemankumensis TaxID=481181 RepID=A0ABW3TD60_9RHOB
MQREAGLIPAPRHVSAWDDLTGTEQMAMLAEVGAALGRGTAGFVAASDHTLSSYVGNVSQIERIF